MTIKRQDVVSYIFLFDITDFLGFEGAYMFYNQKKNYSVFNYDIIEKALPARYESCYSVAVRDGFDLSDTSIKNPEIIPSVLNNNDKRVLNPVFTYDRDSVHFGKDDCSEYVNAYGLELLYDIQFGYDGNSFEVIYHNPRDLQLWVDEGDGWKIVFDRFRVGRNENKVVALMISFLQNGNIESGYKMRRFRLRTTGWFGGIIRDKTCSVIKTINIKRPLAVFEGTSITESCNAVSSFNAYSYARILSDIYGFEYLCLAQGGTGMAKPTDTRPSMYQRIDKVLKAKPDILFLEVGINDSPDMNFKNTAEEYIKNIRDNLPNTFVIVIGAYHPKFVPKIPPERCEKDKIIGCICKKYGVPFIELITGYIYGTNGQIIADMGTPLLTGTGTVFEPNGSGTSDRYTGIENVQDGCHCNSFAYRTYSEYFRSAFNAILNDMV